MPTTDIIGYLWRKRQDLDLDGLPEVLDLVADLQHLGLECVRVEDLRIFGVPTSATVQLVRKEPEEWEKLVHDTIVRSAVQHTTDMIHEAGDDE